MIQSSGRQRRRQGERVEALIELASRNGGSGSEISVVRLDAQSGWELVLDEVILASVLLVRSWCPLPSSKCSCLIWRPEMQQESGKSREITVFQTLGVLWL